MKFSPFWAYTLGRLGVFFAVGAVLWLFGFRSWALVFVALLLSLPVSLVALRKQRGAFAHDLAQRAQRDRRRREVREQSRDDEPTE